MAKLTKYIKLQQDVLLQWTYDESNLISENYNVLNDLKANEKSYLSTSQSLNTLYNNALLIDAVVNKFSIADPAKFNYLQLQSFFTPLIQYDTVKIFFPSNFDFSNQGYKGFIIDMYCKDYYNANDYNLSNYFYNDTDLNRQNEILFGVPFLYDNQEWSKYVELKIPSLNHLSNQRVTYNDGSNTPTPNSVNFNLTNGVGLSQSSPISIDFRFINTIQVTFGITYFYTTSPYKSSVPQTPDYKDLGCNIQESSQGDYFEIMGMYNGSNENLDNYVTALEAQGKKISIEYNVSLFEENLLQGTQTFVVNENFSQILKYRPIITFSNTTAFIQVQMNVIDLINNSTDTRISSVGLTHNIFKYGTRLTRINVDNAYAPVIYNKKSDKIVMSGVSKNAVNTQIIKVNYPLIADRYQILTSSSNSNTGGYKPNGQLEIIITPFDNIIKFVIAKKVETSTTVDKGATDSAKNGPVVEAYNLSDLLINAKMYLVFRTDTDALEKEIFYETDQNDYKNGIVVFKIEENDNNIIKKISASNRNFFLIIKSEINDSKSLFYSGTFRLYENLIFVSPVNANSASDNSGSASVTAGNTFEEAVLNNTSSSPTQNQILTNVGSAGNNTGNNAFIVPPPVFKNMLVFLKSDKSASTNAFKSKLLKIINQQQIHTAYNMTFFLIGLTEPQTNEILNLPDVDKTGTQVLSTLLGNVSSNVVPTGANNAVNDLLNQALYANKTWMLQLTVYNPATNTWTGPPSNEDNDKLKTALTPIMVSLKNLGYTLKYNASANPVGNDVYSITIYTGGAVTFQGMTFFG